MKSQGIILAVTRSYSQIVLIAFSRLMLKLLNFTSSVYFGVYRAAVGLRVFKCMAL